MPVGGDGNRPWTAPACQVKSGVTAPSEMTYQVTDVMFIFYREYCADATGNECCR